MATIYLVRHGQASFGAENYDQLSPLGQRQADATGEYFQRVGVRFDRVYSGDLSRQQETCERVVACQGGGVDHIVDPRFNEIRNDEQIEKLAPVVTESNPLIKALMEKGLSSSKDYQKVIEAVFNYWVSHDCADYGIQGWPEYSGLVRDAVKELMFNEGPGKTIGIFTSGGTIATVVAQVLGLGGDQTYKFYEPVFNCSVTQLFYSGENISLSYFNDRSLLQLLGLEKDENLVSYR
jgi:broad specificity phosphatase PhoE